MNFLENSHTKSSIMPKYRNIFLKENVSNFRGLFFCGFVLKLLAYFIYFQYFIFHYMMTDFSQELKRLQKLSCIALSPEEEKKFWTQLTDIIGFLGQLPETKGNADSKKKNDKLSLRTIKGVQEDKNGEKLMKNVKHEVVNNSIVIKSVLS